MNRTRFSFAVLSLASASLCTLAGCSSPKAQAPAAPAARVAQVRTVTLAPQTVVDRTSLPAALEPRHRAILAAEVGGAVESVRVELGQAVGKGQVLATIDERALAQQVAEAEAWLRQANLQFERAKNLFERKAVTKAQLLDAVTNRDVASARLASATVQTALVPPRSTSADIGTRKAPSRLWRGMSRRASMPGFNRPSALASSASTVRVRDCGSSSAPRRSIFAGKVSPG